jgi:hypothetical protein
MVHESEFKNNPADTSVLSPSSVILLFFRVNINHNTNNDYALVLVLGVDANTSFKKNVTGFMSLLCL